jgi:hypothetical protein
MHKQLSALAITAALASQTAFAGMEDVVKNLEISGLIELEASFEEPENGNSTSGFNVATVELGLFAPINDWIEGELVFLYEDTGETEFDVDTATITIAQPNGPWFITGGLFGLPFGRFDTNLVSDPLTLELGETYEGAAQFGVESSGFSASAYIANGKSNKLGDNGEEEAKIDTYGLDVGYSMESGDSAMSFAAGYINNIGTTDALEINPIEDYVPGWFFSANLGFGGLNVIAEYLAASDQFIASELAWEGRGAEPSAWHVEAAYTFNDITAALGYQATEEAAALGLPESKILAAVSTGLMKNATLSLEWARSENYDATKDNAVTLQLAVEF